MKKVFQILFLLPLAAAAAETWLPPERPLPDLRELTKKGEVVAVSSKLGNFSPAAFESTLSLDGTWKLTPLETSEKPFGRASSEELKFAEPNFNDSAWRSIRVPLNWFLMPENDYRRIFREGSTQDPDSNGGNDLNGVVNPYVKGWYRHTLELKKIPAEFRAVLSFERIGYEAELFVNGHPAGRHHGDFVPFSTDVTGLLKPGKNVIALRVLSDYRPPDGKFIRTHGAMWGYSTYKGGIWGHVKLDWIASPRIESVQLVSPASGKLRMHAVVINAETAPFTVTPGISVVQAQKDATPRGMEYSPVVLKPGRNELDFTFDEPDPKLWSVEHPNLYFATLFFRNDKRIVSADTQRFGFRDFTVRGTKFYLNGKETYLFFESAHSARFGGSATPSGHSLDPAEMIAGYKKLGYNMLRTAHMPVPQEVLDRADELGMMIYDEWGMAFITAIDEPAFEKNNLAELARFVATDHNHPSVAMWSLGNEVPHRRSPALVRQLDKQTDLVRELDLQKRPVCTFAGVGNVVAYGRSKLKTDVIDLHIYTGISDPWTLIESNMDQYYRWGEEIYGNGKTLDKPIIISECVGGGWGMRYDDSYRPGDIERYLRLMRQDFTWGNPGAAGYSGSIGIAAASDRNCGVDYLQNRLGRRVLEQLRLNEHVSGFAPWFADHRMKSAPVWNQRYYPGLRLPNSFAPRQLFAGSKRPVEAFLINSGDEELKSPRLELSLDADGKTTKLGSVAFSPSAPGTRLSVQTTLTVPESVSGKGELKLTLFDDDREVGRNSYDVTLHPVPSPIADALPVAVLSDDPTLAKELRRMGINGVRVKVPAELAQYRRAVFAGNADFSKPFQAAVRNWVEQGGFLLILEPENDDVPVFPEYRTVLLGTPLVEAAVPEHPIFHALEADDFDTWAENSNGFVAERILLPLDETLLAAKGRFLSEPQAGTTIAEARLGKGRLLISTVGARKIADRNGAAATLLGNLFRYFASPVAEPVPSPFLKQQLRNSFDADMRQAEFIDLRKYANRGFRDDKEGDGKGGWTDQGDNDYRQMPSGKQTAAGITFDLIDPAANHGNGCIMLKGTQFHQVPAAVNGIRIGAKAKALYFLHTAAFVTANTPFARYRILYSDGTGDEIPLIPGRNIADWWSKLLPENAYPAFPVANPVTKQVSFYAFEWNNPAPEKTIESLDFISDGMGPVAVLAAVTLLPPNADADVLRLASAKQRWAQGNEPSGVPGTAQIVKTATPVGNTAVRIDFPATGRNDFPFAIGRIDLSALKERIPTHLSVLFRSDSEGVVDLMVPEKAWRGSLSVPLELGLSKGRFVRVRFDLKKDFHLVGSSFPLSEIRDEIGFFNGKDRINGYPRRKVSFEIADLRYEFADQSNIK